LDFITEERNVPRSKCSLYNTLALSMKQEEFKWFFKNNASRFINERVGNILYSVIMEKSEECLFTLICKYIEVKS
jgi:hypothetical protein